MSARFMHLLMLTALSALSTCIPEYHPPTLGEPHATIKVRRTYDTQAGATLNELLLVDDHSLLHNRIAATLASAPLIDSSLVYPTPATFVMSSTFSHQELHSVDETYYDQEMYSDFESYDCSSGFGTNAVHRTCSRTVTRYRPITRYRQVMRMVDVTDAECRAANRFAPAVDRVYLLQYNYQEHGACSLACFEQAPNPDGTFSNTTCPAAPPPQ
jgi:hypothetical protein